MLGKRYLLGVVTAVAGATAAAAIASAPPVGPLPAGPTKEIRVSERQTFTVTLPKPTVAGGVWRIARPIDASVVREIAEGDSPAGVWVRFRAIDTGTTRIVFALTRGETSRALAARRFHVTVMPASAG